MGLFDKKKKQKEQEELERIAAPYRAKTLAQLTASVERMEAGDVKEIFILIKEYLIRLFTTPEVDGGFGMSADRVTPYMDQAAEFFRNLWTGMSTHTGFDRIRFIPYKRKDESGNERIANWPIEFLRHYIKLGYPYEYRYRYKGEHASELLPDILECIFRYDKEEGFFIYSFDMEELADDNCPLYDKWLYEPGVDSGIITCRLAALMVVVDEEALTQYGLYRKKNGVQTDEFITFDDIKFENDEYNQKLKAFLNGCQTERMTNPIWDACGNLAIYRHCN